MAETLFTFHSPVSQADTMRLIEDAISSIGGKVKAGMGYMECSWKRKGFPMGVKFEFYISHGDSATVRVTTPVNNFSATMSILSLKKDSVDIIWERFVEALLSRNPGVDFGLSNGDLYVDAVMYADNEVQQIYTSTTRHHPSYGKAMIGNALFGEVGAMVGAMGGISRTKTQSFSQAAKNVYMKVRMSNGRVREGNISVKSKEYNQIMVNMKQV